METTVYAHCRKDDVITCKRQTRTPSGKEDYPVLEIGELKIFPESWSQLDDIATAIDQCTVDRHTYKSEERSANAEASAMRTTSNVTLEKHPTTTEVASVIAKLSPEPEPTNCPCCGAMNCTGGCGKPAPTGGISREDLGYVSNLPADQVSPPCP